MKTLLTILIIFLFAELTYSQGWVRRLDGRSVWSLGLAPNGDIYAGGLTGANSRIWKSTDQGFTWDTVYIGAGQTMWSFAFDSAGTIYVANFSNGLLKSTDNGLSFTLIPSNPNFNGKNLQGVACGSSGYVFVTTSTGFMRSTDNGATFTETGLSGFNCLPLLVDVDSSNIVYVGVTSAGGTGVGFYRSTDNGATFSGNLNPGKNGYAITQESYSGWLYMGTTTAPYNIDRSMDRGLTWTTLTNMPGATRGVAARDIERVLTTGNFGVNYSWDSGNNFLNMNFTLSCTPALVADGKIFTGVSGAANGGVYFSGIPPAPNIQNNNIVLNYKLNQNYPNPFNPTTNINFSITKKELTNLTIFDVLGREVATLVNETLNAGSYNYKFSTDDFQLLSGIYFYRLNAGEFSETKRMLLFK